MADAFDWDLLQSFLAVARTGKLTAAAKRLKIDHSTLSRRLTTLESSLGAKLFDRRATGYALTLHGEHLLTQAETVENSIFAIKADAAESNSRVAGTVRIGSPDGFGTTILAPAIGRLMAAYPYLDIELVATSRTFNLSQREADIAIGLARPTHGRLYARKLTDYELGVYAAKAEPALWANVKRTADLVARPFISYIDDLIFAPELDYVRLVATDLGTRFRSSNLIAQLQATAAGAGLCVLPCFLADKDERLIRVLPDHVRLARMPTCAT